MKFAAIALIAGSSWAVTASAAGPDLSKLPPASDKTGLTFAKDIQPILQASCVRCHSGQRAKGGLHLDSLDGVLKSGENGPEVVAGKSDQSPLVIAAARIDPDTAMPPTRGGRRGGPGGEGRGGPGGFGPGGMLAGLMVKQGDTNGDGKLSHDEFVALAGAWFEKMDADKSGKLNQQQFTAALAGILQSDAPPRQDSNDRRPRGENGGERRPGGQGFNPASMIGPALFALADSDKDGSLTEAELKATFGKWAGAWDAQKTGSLTQEQIADGLNQVLPRPNFQGREGPGGPGPGPGRDGAPGGPPQDHGNDRPQQGGGNGGPPGAGGADGPPQGANPGGPRNAPGGQDGPPQGANPGGPRNGPGGQDGPPQGANPDGPRNGPGGRGGADGPPQGANPGGPRDGNARNGPGGPGGNNNAKPLTAEQVGILRAWIDQGAK
ncbi:MAG TPA: c-type cytochrome domain-containing protein [Tepidisphaeraceae bacterium]|nr:c-type cytochrome domain-containing protein [Tepidisphaeraceae bacterium]